MESGILSTRTRKIFSIY